MPTVIRVAGQFRDRLLVLSAVSLLVVVTLAIPIDGRAIQDVDSGSERARVRVVHGIADAGPLDIYVDGSLALIGILFADTSGDVVLTGGEHAFAVVPTGGSPESAIAAGTIALSEETLAYAALLGTLDSASVGLFEVDDRPLDQGRARFRIISGVPDVGEITPIFAGGDALSEPLGFGDASQYASIDAGTYDLDLLEAASGVSLLALPGTPFAEGTTTDRVSGRTSQRRLVDRTGSGDSSRARARRGAIGPDFLGKLPWARNRCRRSRSHSGWSRCGSRVR